MDFYEVINCRRTIRDFEKEMKTNYKLTTQDKLDRFSKNIDKISGINCPQTKGYIVTIVENRAIDIYRRKKAHPAVPYNEETVGLSVVYAGNNVLAGCILKLPARQRHLLILKYHHGYELKEIATMLGITYANALAIEKRAKKKLKSLCEEADLI